MTEATWRKFMRHMLGSASGVIRGFASEFAVFGDGTGMNVKASTGECWIRGHYGESTTQKTLSITAAHATLARKDRAILRADFTNNRVELDVLTGTAAGSPLLPALTQSTTVWETSLAQVDIPAADTAIGAAQVTDLRQYCYPGVRYYKNALQSIPNTTNTEIDFQAAQTVSAGDITQIDNRTFELQRNGLWALQTSVQWDTGVIGRRSLSLVKSGSGATVRYAVNSASAAGDFPAQNVATMIRLAAGERVSAEVWHNQGAALNVLTTYNATNIAIMWLGP